MLIGIILAHPFGVVTVRPTRSCSPRLCLHPKRVFGRCEPWAPESASLLQVVNVVGRFHDSSAWSERTSYVVLDDENAATTDQAATAKRGAFAKKFSQVERRAFEDNVPNLPFADAALASSVGQSVDAFAAMPVERAHLAVVFDALAQSKTTLVSREDADARIAAWRTADGSFAADTFGGGLRRGLLSVLAANAVLYFFVASGVAIVGRVLLDSIQPASAAIPSITEYDAVQYKKKPPPTPPPAPLSTAELAPADGLRLVRSGLLRAGALLDAANLEGVRALLREPLFASFLGFTPGVRGNAANLTPPAALSAAGIPRDVLTELLLSIKRLDDFCLSNRVIVFNQEDIDQVNALMAKSGTDGGVGGRLDLDEARGFIADANELLDEAEQSLRRR